MILSGFVRDLPVDDFESKTLAAVADAALRRHECAGHAMLVGMHWGKLCFKFSATTCRPLNYRELKTNDE